MGSRFGVETIGWFAYVGFQVMFMEHPHTGKWKLEMQVYWELTEFTER